jgi:hypothetical protein
LIILQTFYILPHILQAKRPVWLGNDHSATEGGDGGGAGVVVRVEHGEHEHEYLNTLYNSHRHFMKDFHRSLVVENYDQN